MQIRPDHLIVLFVVSLACFVHAEIIVYEGFVYPPSSDIDGHGDYGYSWSTNKWEGGVWRVSQAGLTHPAVNSHGHSVIADTPMEMGILTRRFDDYILGNGESVWFSCLLRVHAHGTWWFSIGQPDINRSNSFGIITGGNARLGIGDGAIISHSLMISTGRTYWLVGNYTYDEDGPETLEMWLDPSAESQPVGGDYNTTNYVQHSRDLGSGANVLGEYELYYRSIGGIEFDELRIATSWAGLTSAIIEIPHITHFSIEPPGATIYVNAYRSTATNLIEVTTDIMADNSWHNVDSFIPDGFSSFSTLTLTNNTNTLFIRVREQ